MKSYFQIQKSITGIQKGLQYFVWITKTAYGLQLTTGLIQTAKGCCVGKWIFQTVHQTAVNAPMNIFKKSSQQVFNPMVKV